MMNSKMDEQRVEKEKSKSKAKRVSECSDAASLSVPRMEGLAQKSVCVRAWMYVCAG